MAYVLLVCDRGYGPSPREEGTRALMREWARRFDDSDGSVTVPFGRPGSYGGAHRHLSLPHVYGDDQRRSVLKRGYDQAALLAHGGQLGIALGHGFSSASDAWVDLAPAGAARVRAAEVANAAAPPGGRSTPLSANEELLNHIGACLRRHFVRRVAPYSCSVGYGETGSNLVQAIATLWRTPVRGLRGDAVVRGGLSGDVATMRDAVTIEVRSPAGRQVVGAFGRPFEGLITDPSLWLLRRPAPQRAVAR